MLAFIFNFGTLEILLVAIVAVLVFGRKLPEVAVQAAGVVHKVRRSLADLRRETGIDEELRKARRTIDAAVPREVRRMDVREVVRRQVEDAARAAETSVDSDAQQTPAAETDAGTEAGPAKAAQAERLADEDPPVKP